MRNCVSERGVETNEGEGHTATFTVLKQQEWEGFNSRKLCGHKSEGTKIQNYCGFLYS